MMMNADLQSQLNFVKELDKLKQVIRRNYLYDGTRSENTAEHSWHAALSAFILQDFADEAVDICKVGKMLLIHDVVEIEAGDTYVYDMAALEGQDERELEAAHKLFGMLPTPMSDEFLNLWLEFEARQTPEARFAKAIDRFMPMFANYESGGISWLENNVQEVRMRELNGIIAEGSQALWQEVERMIADAISRNFLQ